MHEHTHRNERTFDPARAERLDDPARLKWLPPAEVIAHLGHVAILDWRTDVEQPPGPPLAHRIEPEQVALTLESQHWSVTSSMHVGTYSYLIICQKKESGS